MGIMSFYGIGVEGYDAENDTHLNPYSDESFYYVTASGDAGKNRAYGWAIRKP